MHAIRLPRTILFGLPITKMRRGKHGPRPMPAQDRISAAARLSPVSP